jgi:serine/threonine protein kinase
MTRTYFLQLINAVSYMHERGFAHRDIKPENVMLTKNYVLKLADYGFATLLEGKDKSGYLSTRLGTEGYMAPEIATKKYQG